MIAYKQRQQEKRFELAIQEIKNRQEEIDKILERYEDNIIPQIKKLLDIYFDYSIQNNQERKIKLLANGYVNSIENLYIWRHRYEKFTSKYKGIIFPIKDIAKNKYNFNHPLQRQSGQWNRLAMSNLIDSAIRLYPIYPALVEENEDGIFGVIDGKQRLTIFASYANNEFSLHKSLKPVEIDGVKYEIAGKKFDKLDEEVKDRFKSREFQLYIMSKATEDDIREIFARINSSKGLSNTQRRTTVENEKLASVIFDLKSHPVFEKLTTPTQRKKDEDKDIIRQVLMLTEMSDKYDFGSFRNNDINKFLEMYNDNINQGKIKVVSQALDKIDEAFETLSVKKTTTPILIYSYYCVLQEEKDIQKWNKWVKNFIDTYDTNEEYKQYCNGSGTAASEMVKGRVAYFMDALKKI